jgi:SAM-dependent methyltransferase
MTASEVRTDAFAVRAACPCCGASGSDAQLAVRSDPPAETLPFDKHTDFASGYTTERVFFSYYRCRNCGALYCRTFYTQGQLEALYGRQAENMGNVPLAARQRAQEGYARLLLKHSRKAGGFLEIGPDIGLFAQYCARAGSFDHFWMYEPNRLVHAELAGRLAGYVHTIRDTMSPDGVPPRSTSTAVLIHVLDHLLDPLGFLAELNETLEPGGVLLVVTHNTDSLLARALGRRFPPFALQHPQLYSPRSITTLFERAEFEIVEIADAVNYFPLMHLARAGLTVFKIPDLLPDIQGPIVPIRLGNMAVVGRKKHRLTDSVG